MPKIPIHLQVRKPKVGPDRRGKLSKMLRKLEIGQCLVCPAGYPRHPHQTVFYHNSVSKKEGAPHRWSASVDVDMVWRIHRVE